MIRQGRKNVDGARRTRPTSRAASSAYLAAKMAAKAGKKVIGAVGGLNIPPVDIWIAGLQVLRPEGCTRARRC